MEMSKLHSSKAYLFKFMLLDFTAIDCRQTDLKRKAKI